MSGVGRNAIPRLFPSFTNRGVLRTSTLREFSTNFGPSVTYAAKVNSFTSVPSNPNLINKFSVPPSYVNCDHGYSKTKSFLHTNQY